MEDQIKFTIITPSIGRNTISKTIESIKSQNYDNYEHIIIFDGHEKECDFTLFNNDHHTKVIFTHQTKNFGNYQRRIAAEYATGDYIMYLDDDDWYLPNAFNIIADFIKQNNYPKFGIYPCLRAGNIFFNRPPGSCMTVSCQYFHSRLDHEGNLVRWLEDDASRSYLLDGAFVDHLRDKFGYVALESSPLVQVDYASSGSMEPVKL